MVRIKHGTDAHVAKCDVCLDHSPTVAVIRLVGGYEVDICEQCLRVAHGKLRADAELNDCGVP
ncbi:hypothetical protein ACLNGM_22195 [Aureimonas phyllosphaerae]|uniref:hypothetical protein n=1 Tax=Aureimonas phyllosphaerae TaxID=1166078 RepID=UPI003A5C6F3F